MFEKCQTRKVYRNIFVRPEFIVLNINNPRLRFEWNKINVMDINNILVIGGKKQVFLQHFTNSFNQISIQIIYRYVLKVEER